MITKIKDFSKINENNAHAKYVITYNYTDADGDATNQETSKTIVAASEIEAVKKFLSDERFDVELKNNIVIDDGEVIVNGEYNFSSADEFSRYDDVIISGTSEQIQNLRNKIETLEKEIAELEA